MSDRAVRRMNWAGWRRIACGLLLVALLAGCGSGVGTGVPLANRATGPERGIVTVRAGDTVYSIARRYGVSQRELIERNGLRPPYLLRVGDRLMISTPRLHVVRAGDTVSEIAEAYGVSQRELIARNGLRPPYLIRVGDRLRLPGAAAPTDGSADGVVAARPPQPVAEQSSPAGTARRNAGAGLQDGRRPYSGGGRLHFPAPRPTAGSAAGTAAGNRSAELPPPPTPRPGPRVGTVAIAPAATPAGDRMSAAGPVGDLTPPRRAGQFIWPVEGRVIGGFGPRASGLHNDGINIAAPQGTPVRAAENGVVVYAGNELRGFGNLLLIKHADDWITAYAHADSLKVGRGDRVGRGQVIATVGSTGNVGRPQLHFEIRKGQRPIDPRDELPRTRTSSVPDGGRALLPGG